VTAEMRATIEPNPKSLLSVTGALEAATGLVLLIAISSTPSRHALAPL